MSDQPETIVEIIADFRRLAESLSGLMPLTTRLGEEHFNTLADRIEAAYKWEFGNTQKMYDALDRGLSIVHGIVAAKNNIISKCHVCCLVDWAAERVVPALREENNRRQRNKQSQKHH